MATKKQQRGATSLSNESELVHPQLAPEKPRFKMTERHWKFRRPPDGFLLNQLMLCIMPQPCVFQDSCPNAHSEDELTEWKKRLVICDGVAVQHFDEENLEDCRKQIVQRMNESEDPKHIKSIVTELIGGFTILCDENLYVMHIDPGKDLAWMFTIKSAQKEEKKTLERVFFLNSCPEFQMSYCILNNKEGAQKRLKLQKGIDMWENVEKEAFKEISILIQFKANKFGNYGQEVIFDFGGFPKVVKKLGVQVANEESLTKFMKFNPEKEENNELSWRKKYSINAFKEGLLGDFDDIKFPMPPNIENLVLFDAFKHLDIRLTKSNYRQRLHTLLYIEEYQRRADLQSITFHVEDFEVCLNKTPSKKFPGNTAIIEFNESVLEILTKLVGKTGKGLLRVNEYSTTTRVISDPVVYEVIIQSIVNNSLVFELSGELFSLIKNSAIPADIDVCFCLVDVFQPMHLAIENVDLEILFPTVSSWSNFPDSRTKTSSNDTLSPEQKNAFNVIMDCKEEAPVLLLGPFGAGKTRTIATCVNSILAQKNPKNKILICTHSNSAADHYIEEYFHPKHKIIEGELDPSLIPLRINWEHRYTSSVSDKVLAYCLQDLDTGLFASPTKENVDKHSLIICTLVTSEALYKLNLPKDYFSHVFIDEAAQAMEVEALVPLLLATPQTRIVLAGDHLQMGESLSSIVAKNLGLEKSLLERLFEYYPFDADCKLKLLENFRSYKEIVDLSSHLFYEDSLISNKLREEGVIFPIEFYGAEGEEYLSSENPSYENLAEAVKLLEIIKKICTEKKEDENFGLSSVCVVAFYPAQVRCIRKVLRKNWLSSVRVESVNNIQGLEFDILLITTVRTYCNTTMNDESFSKDMGFFNNPKLLNTAITRARYRVIFVGDPRALCTIGNCKTCWKFILRYCEMHKTFFNNVPYNELIRPLGNSRVESPSDDSILEDIVLEKFEKISLLRSPIISLSESNSTISPIDRPEKVNSISSIDRPENDSLISSIDRPESVSTISSIDRPEPLSTGNAPMIPGRESLSTGNAPMSPGRESVSSSISSLEVINATEMRAETKPPPGFPTKVSYHQIPNIPMPMAFQPQVVTPVYQNYLLPGYGLIRQPIGLVAQQANTMVMQQTTNTMGMRFMSPFQPNNQQTLPSNGMPNLMHNRPFFNPPQAAVNHPQITQQQQYQQQQHQHHIQQQLLHQQRLQNQQRQQEDLHYKTQHQQQQHFPSENIINVLGPETQSSKRVILVPAECKNTLRQKIQFIHEYCLLVLEFIGAKDSLKNYIKRSTVTAFQDLESVEDLDKLLANRLLFEIELKVESCYVFVHDNLTEWKATGFVPLPKDKGSLDARFTQVDRKLNSFFSMVPWAFDGRNAFKSVHKVKCFVFVLKLMRHELDVCRKLLSNQKESVYFEVKINFLESKTVDVENMAKMVPAGCLFTPAQSKQTAELDSNSKTPSSALDGDNDSKEWFSKRRNDPYVREYQATHDRRFAGRLPSPTPESDK